MSGIVRPCEQCSEKSCCADSVSKRDAGSPDGMEKDVSMQKRVVAGGPERLSQKTFFRRTLPEDLVDFSCAEGKVRLTRAIAAGHGHAFVPLIAQLQTQPFPAACGLTTLTVLLNALQIDPGLVWHQPWRWYSESFLYCCQNKEHIETHGITIEEFACIAGCNGLDAITHRVISDEEARRLVIECVSDTNCKSSSPAANESAESSTRHPDIPNMFMAVSYSRKALGQTGSGHFSPVAAYDVVTDSVLILDTARFKYPPFWVDVARLNTATCDKDPSTGHPRGYIVAFRGSNISPNPLIRLRNALASIEECLRDKTASTWSTEDLVGVLNAAIDVSLKSRFLRCRSMIHVPTLAVEALRASPLHEAVAASSQSDRDIVALFFHGILATTSNYCSDHDAVWSAALGCSWSSTNEALRNAILAVRNSVLTAVDGFEAESV